MEDLQTYIILWTKLDKELKEATRVVSTIRKNRDSILDKLCPLIRDNQLDDNVFSIPSLQANVSLKEQKVSESMSYKFLEEKFNDYFDSQEECLKLIQYLKDNRKKETSLVLKSSILKKDDEE